MCTYYICTKYKIHITDHSTLFALFVTILFCNHQVIQKFHKSAENLVRFV